MPPYDTPLCCTCVHYQSTIGTCDRERHGRDPIYGRPNKGAIRSARNERASPFSLFGRSKCGPTGFYHEALKPPAGPPPPPAR